MLIFTKALGILLTPPGIVVLLAIGGLVVRRRSRTLGLAMVWVSLGVLFVFSMSVTGSALEKMWQRSVKPLAETATHQPGDIDAIVVLGGGRNPDQPQYGGDTVSRFTLERLRYAARLHRASGLPILVSGGSVFGSGVPEAELMRRALEEDLGVTAQWIEGRSRTTMENALYSRAILGAAGKKKIWLVTDAWHMPRAYWAFRKAGIDATMAPTGFATAGADTPLDFLPSSRGLTQTDIVFHELLGTLWYRIRYRNVGAAGDEGKTGPPSGS